MQDAKTNSMAAKQTLRKLLPQQQEKFKSLVDKYFEKAVQYLEDTFDFNDQILAHSLLPVSAVMKDNHSSGLSWMF